MKLSISVLLKKESGGWQNILYEIINSALNENYDLLKKELVKKLAIKVNKSEKRLRKTSIVTTFLELRNKNISHLLSSIEKNQEISINSQLDITINEWAA